MNEPADDCFVILLVLLSPGFETYSIDTQFMV